MPIKPENKSRYPKDWALRSRFVRFYRAKNRCEWCGAENYKPHPVTGSKVILTCAHIYNHNPEACSLLNLAALCQRCHNRHDAKMRAKNRNKQAKDVQLELFPKEANMLTVEDRKKLAGYRKMGPQCQLCKHFDIKELYCKRVKFTPLKRSGLCQHFEWCQHFERAADKELRKRGFVII